MATCCNLYSLNMVTSDFFFPHSVVTVSHFFSQKNLWTSCCQGLLFWLHTVEFSPKKITDTKQPFFSCAIPVSLRKNLPNFKRKFWNFCATLWLRFFWLVWVVLSFLNFVMLPNRRSSTRGFSQIWLYIQHESRKF